MKIQPKMKSLYFGQGYSWGFSALKDKLLQSEYSDLDGIWILLRFYGCPNLLQVWWKSDQNWRHYWSDKVEYGFLALKGK